MATYRIKRFGFFGELFGISKPIPLDIKDFKKKLDSSEPIEKSIKSDLKLLLTSSVDINRLPDDLL